ncbi:hypothetical protein NDU88_007499 [Pleurodeles waltl]|uniref:Uncharacterized protein n=1 Tax=Pleurodeles waltl TaxID=8319 RepID=A0AAV7PLL1_PLEWA|nr:hypothetical protein NDU88_007499 [Pleurodeles waltl]
MGGRGQQSGDGARLIPSLRRGRHKSEVNACHLRAIRCPGVGEGLGAGPGSSRAPAVIAKCLDPAVGSGRGWRPAPVLGAWTSREAVEKRKMLGRAWSSGGRRSPAVAGRPQGA